MDILFRNLEKKYLKLLQCMNNIIERKIFLEFCMISTIRNVHLLPPSAESFRQHPQTLG